MTAPPITVRPLHGEADFQACIALECGIWGVSPAEATSSVTLHSLAMDRPRTGLVLGAFQGEDLVGLALVEAAFEPGTAYGLALGVRSTHRDAGVGHRLQAEVRARLLALGVHRFCYTFDPLESRNSHLYLNRQGARGVAFRPDAYAVEGELCGGLPMDRLLAEVDLLAPPPPPPPPMSEALARHPVATPEEMPFSGTVLVDIPPDIARWRREDPEGALAASRAARAVFTEYVNVRGLVAVHLVRMQGDSPRSLILLARPGTVRP